MAEIIGKVFKSGGSMAIRVPKSIDLSGISEVTIEQNGDTIVMRARKNVSKDEWVELFEFLQSSRGEKIERIRLPRREKNLEIK